VTIWSERLGKVAIPGICVVGCGQIGSAHAQRLKGKARLKFQSRRRESAEELSVAVGGEGVFNSLDEALTSPDVDAVVVATPPEAHAQQVIQALEAGKAVFVEKPLCTTLAEIDAIEAAVGNRLVLVGENYYYKPSLHRIKSWLDGGEIGQVVRARVRKCMTQEADGWKAAHGSLFEGGIHFVALLNGMFGRPTAVQSAKFPGYSKGQAERHACLVLEYGQASVELEYAWDTPSLTKGTFQNSWIEGDGGRIVFETNGIYARLSGKRSKFCFPGFADLMGYEAMFDDFLDCILTGREPVSSLTRARQDLETVFRAYEVGGLVS
jgi:predicted dehydrogenase